MSIFNRNNNKPLVLRRVRFDLDADTYINLRELSSQELLHYQQTIGNKEVSNLDFIYDLVARCAVDDEGLPIFKDAGDVKDHFNVGLSTLVSAQQTVMNLSGIGDAAPKN